MDQTNIPADDLKMQLRNLASPHMGKLLIKDNQKTPNFTLEETIQINKDFSFKSLKITMTPTIFKKVYIYNNLIESN